MFRLLMLILGVCIFHISSGDTHAVTNRVGGDIVIEHDIDDDLNAIGDSVTINSNISGDARVVAKKVLVRGKINGDLMVTGGDISLEGAYVGGVVHALSRGDINVDSDSVVGGDIKAFGGNVNIEGNVEEGAKIIAKEEATIGENVEGDIQVAEDGFFQKVIGQPIRQAFKSVGDFFRTIFDDFFFTEKPQVV